MFTFFQHDLKSILSFSETKNIWPSRHKNTYLISALEIVQNLKYTVFILLYYFPLFDFF